MDPVTSTLLGLCIGALLVYGVLRFASYTPSRNFDPRQAARTHGLWTAVIALFVSGATNNQRFRELGPVWVDEQLAYLESQGFLTILVQTSAPMIALGGIYVIAQFTWPRSGAAVRISDPPARRVIDFLPRNLALATTFVAILAGFLIAASASIPGVSGESRTRDEAVIPVPDRVDGTYFATVLGAALITLLAGVLLAVLVIVRRRRIPTLSAEDDVVVRKIAINRLLRTAILSLTAMINSTSAYAANGLPANLLDTIDTAAFWGHLVNPVGFFSVAVLVTVIVWAPPKLIDRSPEPISAPLATSGSYARAQQISNAGRRLASMLLIVPGIPILLTVWYSSDSAAPLVLIVTGYAAFLAIQIGVEGLLRKNHAVGPRHRVPILGLLPVWLLITLPASTCIALATAAVLVHASSAVSAQSILWLAAVILLFVLAAAGAWLSLTRPPLSHADGAQDRLLRAVTMYRIFRAFTSAMLMLTASLVSTHALTLSTVFGVYQPPSAGVSAAVTTANALLFALAVIIVLLPGPVRPLATKEPGEAKALYP